MTTKDRIGELYPGEEFKSIRAKLYRIPDFLKFDQDDDAIHREAAACGAPKEAPKPKVLEGEMLTPEEAAKLAHKEAVDLAATLTPVIVKTAEDYEQASLGFAQINKMITANEAKRKKLKAPILESGRILDAEFKAAEEILLRERDRYEKPMIAFKQAERDLLRDQEAERQRLLDVEKARLILEAEEAKKKLQEAQALESATAQSDDAFLAALDDDYEPSVVPERVQAVEEALRAVAMVGVRTVLPEMAAPVTATGSRVSYPWKVEVVDENRVERVHCSPDPRKLNALAKLLKEQLGDIRKVDPLAYPGLKITEEVSIGGR